MVEICSLAGLEFPEVPIPTYSKSELRNVPEDHEILEWFHKAPPELGWVIGMLAAYGMRPHELLGSEFADDNHRLNIPDGTKTGFRLVTPVPRDWVDVFDLRSERRPVINSTKKQALTQWFFNERKKIGLPFTPYAFRHAYAGRLWRFGGSKLDLFTAARLMGHSVAIHAKTYRQFIAPYTVAEAAEAAIAANMEQLEAKLKAPLS
jgi:integrase